MKSFAQIAATGTNKQVVAPSQNNVAFKQFCNKQSLFQQQQYFNEIIQSIQQHAVQLNIQLPSSQTQMQLIIQKYIQAVFTSASASTATSTLNTILSSDQLHSLFLLGVFVINLVWFNQLNECNHNQINLQPFITLLSSLQILHCIQSVDNNDNNDNVKNKTNKNRKEKLKDDDKNKKFLDVQAYFERCFLFEPFNVDDHEFVYQMFQFIHQEFDAVAKQETAEKEKQQATLSKYIKAQTQRRKRY